MDVTSFITVSVLTIVVLVQWLMAQRRISRLETIVMRLQDKVTNLEFPPGSRNGFGSEAAVAAPGPIDTEPFTD